MCVFYYFIYIIYYLTDNFKQNKDLLMIILLFIESRLNFINIPLNSTFKSSINYEYIVYRNENPISCFLEFLVSCFLVPINI